MGATLFLKPRAEQFDIDQIERFLATVRGLEASLDDPHLLSFSDATRRRRIRRALNLQDHAAPEHRQPYLRYSPDLIEFGINWWDNRRGDGRRFLEWVLTTFECTGQDDEGYHHADSSACRFWINHWLPQR